MTERALRRSRDAYVGGVCAGIAERFDCDVIVVRILAVLLALATAGLAVIVYFVLWVMIPRSEASVAPYDIRPEQAESSTYGFVSCATDEDVCPETISFPGRIALVCGLGALFVAVLVLAPPVVSGTRWWQFWPIALIICGICLIVVPMRMRSASALHAAGLAIASLGATITPMSLGIMSWETLPNAFAYLWILVLLGIVLYVFGLIRGVSALMMAGALCISLFGLATLYLFGVPGELDHLELMMPNGQALVVRGALQRLFEMLLF